MEKPTEREASTRSLIRKRIIDKVTRNFAQAEAQERVAGCESRDSEGLVASNRELESKYNETFESLNKVRGVALELSEQILDKEFRITHLEKNLHEAQRKARRQEEEIGEWRERLEQVRAQMRAEAEVLESQVRRLSEIVKDRDEKILAMTKEGSRAAVEMKEQRKKNGELLTQLDVTCDTLSTLVSETNEREKMLNTMENELKRKQVERQGLYLDEINRNKRLFINVKVKENLMAQMIQGKNAQIVALSSEIGQLRKKLEKISTTFNELSGPDAGSAGTCRTEDRAQVMAISNSSKNKVHCTVSTPCSMRMLNGTAKITI